jgi:hypothetical protein
MSTAKHVILAVALAGTMSCFAGETGSGAELEFNVQEVSARSNHIPGRRKVDSPSWQLGSKKVIFRRELFDQDDAFEMFVGNERIGTAKMFYYGRKKGVLPELKLDVAKQQAFSSFVADSDKTYAYTVAPTADGKLALNFDTALTAPGDFCFFLRSASDFRKGVTVNGESLAFAPLETLGNKRQLLKGVKGPAEIIVAVNDPAKRFSVAIPQGCSANLFEQKSARSHSMWIWLKPGKGMTKWSYLVDLK